jgi:SAM-dependent methyltransferase
MPRPVDPHYSFTDASRWIARFAPLVPEGGRVLDVACGAGRHSRLFLERGHPVVALDRDISRLGELRHHDAMCAIEADLENGEPWPLGDEQFAAIVVANYLYRPLFPVFLDRLEPGGVLTYETFAMGNERFGKPSNPAFLLDDGELLEIVRDKLHVIAYEALEITEPKPALVQRICATNDRT